MHASSASVAARAGAARATTTTKKRPVASARSAASNNASARARARASARDNPGFDPNDPMTWNASAGGDGEMGFTDMGAPVDDLMQLDDAQLATLLGADGATVPVMLDGEGVVVSSAGAAADSGELEAAPAPEFTLAPETAAAAIDKGLAQYKEGNVEEALATFTSALDLPGSGPIRRRRATVKPAGPSLGFEDADVSLNEQIAIHYNCACCYAKLGDVQSGLVSLVRSMEAGYDDYANVRGDDDVASLRADDRFEGIMARFEPRGVLEGVMDALSRGTTNQQRKSGGAPAGGGGGALIGGFIDAVKGKLGGK